MAKRITNQQRIEREVWNDNDLISIICPKCEKAKMLRRQSFIPVLGMTGYLACQNPDCDWEMEKPMKV